MYLNYYYLIYLSVFVHYFIFIYLVSIYTRVYLYIYTYIYMYIYVSFCFNSYFYWFMLISYVHLYRQEYILRFIFICLYSFKNKKTRSISVSVYRSLFLLWIHFGTNSFTFKIFPHPPPLSHLNKLLKNIGIKYFLQKHALRTRRLTCPVGNSIL